MSEIKLIQGDVLEELPKLVDERFDLVIADPPAEMSKEDKAAALWMAYDASSDDAVLFLYGVTASKLVQLADQSGWRVRNIFEIRRDYVVDPEPLGTVVFASKQYPSVNQSIFTDWEYRDVFVEDGTKGNDDHPTTKPKEWFEWIFQGKWNGVLDLFAGLAPVGHICYDKDLKYIGIELDEEAVKLSGIL